MASLYGKHWLDMWANIPIDEVKADWESALKRNNLTLKTCFMAMDKLADDGVQFPPTQPEFVRLCKSMLPKQFHAALPSKRDEELAQESVEKITKMVTENMKPKTDHKLWAKRILETPKGRPDIAIRYAQEAMGVEV